ncbi:hypothetical protein [Shimia marina]|uniref:Uncharacterized protein n=1 Tax=Shimia marina TaxID=321267 RepID=A0A0P1EPH9_9RHOB|nr:hypothetical protein [Shimia marina]CUH52291.1 hypothetical protein SHM7688_01737 [Shimia marina]SFE07761.1 hypothetical protein SAMN04488037_10559 [Shimia marina]
MRSSRFLALSLSLSLGATAAMAEKFIGYGAIEGWNVYIDTEKNSCMVETKDDFDNVIQMGLTDDRGIAYIGVFTKEETNVRTGKKSGVALLIGDDIYVGEATGMRGNITKGYSGGYVLTDNPKVFEDISRSYTMTVFPEEEYAFTVDLSGTAKALDLARKCNQEQLQ